jgi:molecular chaperone DnaK
MLKDTGDKLSATDKQGIEYGMDQVKKALENTDPGALQTALDQLTQAQHKAAEALYKQQASAPAGDAGGPSAGAPSGEAPKSDVIDAEVVDEGKPQ